MDHYQAIENLYRTKYKALVAVAGKMGAPSPEDLVTETITHLLQYPGPPVQDWFKVACSRMKQVLAEARTRVERVNGKPTRVRNGAPDYDLAAYHRHCGNLEPVDGWDPTDPQKGRRVGPRQGTDGQFEPHED